MQGNSGSSTSSKMGNNFTALLDLSFLVSIQYFEMLSVPFQFWVVASISAITHNDFILSIAGSSSISHGGERGWLKGS
jgi:hypothetical protein